MLALLPLFLFLKGNTTHMFSYTGFQGTQSSTAYQSVQSPNLPKSTNRSYVVTHIGSRVVIYPVSNSLYKTRDIFCFNNAGRNGNVYKESQPASNCRPEVYSHIEPNANFMNGLPIMFIKQ